MMEEETGCMFGRKKHDKKEGQGGFVAKLRQGATDLARNPKVRREAERLAKDPRAQRKASDWAKRTMQRFRRR
jgi:hypothetical protein